VLETPPGQATAASERSPQQRPHRFASASCQQRRAAAGRRGERRPSAPHSGLGVAGLRRESLAGPIPFNREKKTHLQTQIIIQTMFKTRLGKKDQKGSRV